MSSELLIMYGISVVVSSDLLRRAAVMVAGRSLSDWRGADHRLASAAGTLRDPYRPPGLAWRRLGRRGPRLSAAQPPQDEHGEDDGEHHRQPAAAAAVAGDYGRDARRVLGQDLLHRLVGGRQCAAADMFDRIADRKSTRLNSSH